MAHRWRNGMRFQRSIPLSGARGLLLRSASPEFQVTTDRATSRTIPPDSVQAFVPDAPAAVLLQVELRLPLRSFPQGSKTLLGSARRADEARCWECNSPTANVPLD